MNEPTIDLNRRDLLGAGAGFGITALASLLSQESMAAEIVSAVAPRAKRVIYLFQSGGPSQMDLFDYKPNLDKLHKTEVPESVFRGQRLTGMTSGQSSFPVARSVFPFEQFGQSGAWLNSKLLPHLADHVDDICFIKSLQTEAINHDPAITFLQSGFQIAGRPSIGAWLSYGLGSENEDLPAFVALTSNKSGQPLYDRLWGAGFLPSEHQGVRFQSGQDPVLYLSNPPGMSSEVRRASLDHLKQLNQLRLDATADAEIRTRIAQYELAFRMQTSVPELTDFADESKNTIEMYGEDANRPGTYAHNCLLARRLSQRGVRFVQLFHRGWDTHGNLPKQLTQRCAETDRPTAALLQDLKRLGLLDETLVIWGGEFGRTVYCQGVLSEQTYGRDHHPRCFTVWMAGGGVKGGMTWGETDDFSYNIARDPVSVHDLHATILHLLGIDHTKLTYRFQGRRYRLTDVHGDIQHQLVG